jgi:hypothetical protein
MYSLLLKRLRSALGLHCISGVRTYPAFSTQKDTHISRVEESTSGYLVNRAPSSWPCFAKSRITRGRVICYTTAAKNGVDLQDP